MCPVLVQGDMAARDMIKTLDRVYELDNIDTVIIGRGGGSVEDLHCFNDEALARKIYESPFPVISAVGHETDFTICDFVADVRASTPSHAAELAVPDKRELKGNVDAITNILNNKILLKHNFYNAKLQALQAKVGSANLERVLQNRQLELDRITDKIVGSVNQRLQSGQNSLARLAAQIDAMSPLKVMARGFSVVSKAGKFVSNASKLNVGDNINVKFCDGNIDCLVTVINDK